MNDIATRTTQLPDTLEDLSQFVLVSKAKLDAYKVKLRAVNRLSDAQEIREQTDLVIHTATFLTSTLLKR